MLEDGVEGGNGRAEGCEGENECSEWKIKGERKDSRSDFSRESIIMACGNV